MTAGTGALPTGGRTVLGPHRRPFARVRGPVPSRLLASAQLCATQWRVGNLIAGGQSGATLAIHLSIRNLDYIRRALEPHYGVDCPVVIAYRATWPDELYIRTTLAEMKAQVRAAKITRTALVLVGPVFGKTEFRDSDLYNADFAHVLRNRGKKAKAG